MRNSCILWITVQAEADIADNTKRFMEAAKSDVLHGADVSESYHRVAFAHVISFDGDKAAKSHASEKDKETPSNRHHSKPTTTTV